jgi:CheY-like chemotaxis protein
VARPFHHAGWVYEEKVDGWRVLAYKDAAGVRVVSGQGRDLTRRSGSSRPRWGRSRCRRSCSTVTSPCSIASSSPASSGFVGDRLRPDVVITDLVMPLLNGIELTRRIRQDCP